jgi:hypothetical protein
MKTGKVRTYAHFSTVEGVLSTHGIFDTQGDCQDRLCGSLGMIVEMSEINSNSVSYMIYMMYDMQNYTISMKFVTTWTT